MGRPHALYEKFNFSKNHLVLLESTLILTYTDVFFFMFYFAFLDVSLNFLQESALSWPWFWVDGVVINIWFYTFHAKLWHGFLSLPCFLFIVTFDIKAVDCHTMTYAWHFGKWLLKMHFFHKKYICADFFVYKIGGS